jgi:hypothetical protein
MQIRLELLSTIMEGRGKVFTNNNSGDEIPQLLLAVIEINPPLVPLSAEMVFVVEKPLHPEGRFHK